MKGKVDIKFKILILWFKRFDLSYIQYYIYSIFGQFED